LLVADLQLPVGDQREREREREIVEEGNG